MATAQSRPLSHIDMMWSRYADHVHCPLMPQIGTRGHLSIICGQGEMKWRDAYKVRYNRRLSGLGVLTKYGQARSFRQQRWLEHKRLRLERNAQERKAGKEKKKKKKNKEKA